MKTYTLATIEMKENKKGQVYFTCAVPGYQYINKSLPELLKEIYEDKVINFVLANINLDRKETDK